MILYLDANALVKLFVKEAGSAEVASAVKRARLRGTAIVTRAEVASALIKAVRVGSLPAEGARRALTSFGNEWVDLIRLAVTETTVGRAEQLAWEQGLRGYDAVHLAAAVLWQEELQETVVLLTYDRELWCAAQAIGQAVLPEHI